LDQDEFDPVLKISAANPTLHLIVLFLLLISTGINTEAKTKIMLSKNITNVYFAVAILLKGKV